MAQEASIKWRANCAELFLLPVFSRHIQNKPWKNMVQAPCQDSSIAKWNDYPICTFERAELFLFHRSLGCGATVLVVQRKFGMAATTPNLMDAMTEDENDESRVLRCPGTIEQSWTDERIPFSTSTFTKLQLLSSCLDSLRHVNCCAGTTEEDQLDPLAVGWPKLK